MKIRITKASDSTYWYADKIGEEFTVIPNFNSPKSYTVNRNEGCGSGGVLVGDCEIVNEEDGGMKTVKRKANVGERILITDKMKGETRYENGAKGDVTKSNSAGIFADINSNTCGIFHEEYEVIIEEADGMGVVEKMQAEINELKSKVAALEGAKVSGKLVPMHKGEIVLSRKDYGKYIRKSPQQIRDEIVAKAKADVADLLKGYYAEFIVNKEKRTIVALHRYPTGPKAIEGRGIAKADPSDCFNVHLGKAIALRRALGLEVPAEYYNAPAPTEVRVGDVIELLTGDVRTISHIDRSHMRYTTGKCNSLDLVTDGRAKIIDDSRE
ncbi:hypothetical protein NGI46_08145 [Peribacillus butanolivorans]|uniref:hypothetical protein n=1 Tax=Peribacillus butanolivorans TaxID=421767 RepID=UPI00207CA9D0|nr:hypothetical protein [Peribacillus butanolivorans]MCO0597438.1 hypothetical protein [Peribacillus butanolivorans]